MIYIINIKNMIVNYLRLNKNFTPKLYQKNYRLNRICIAGTIIVLKREQNTPTSPPPALVVWGVAGAFVVPRGCMGSSARNSSA